MASTAPWRAHVKVIIRCYRNLHILGRREYYFDSLLEAIAFLQWPGAGHPFGAAVTDIRYNICLGFTMDYH